MPRLVHVTVARLFVTRGSLFLCLVLMPQLTSSPALLARILILKRPLYILESYNVRAPTLPLAVRRHGLLLHSRRRFDTVLRLYTHLPLACRGSASRLEPSPSPSRPNPSVFLSLLGPSSSLTVTWPSSIALSEHYWVWTAPVSHS
ncbi:hypothetical protein EI94DRAFT_61484 [Lactarius quietus]|nr:hypothetical protein EI94DRAFT_61484 [Lactarius quietus]